MKPLHPAAARRILNDPNPGVTAQVFPDNSAAKLIILEQEIPEVPVHERRSLLCRPSAHTDAVRTKLFRRLVLQGYRLPIATFICIAILAQIYTSVPAEGCKKLRLKYRSTPIADFGIAWGLADVKCQDTFAFFDEENGVFWKGDNPNNHYWIWFRTVKGEEVIHDNETCRSVELASAFWSDREINHNAPSLHTERWRLSDNTDLHSVVTLGRSTLRPQDTQAIWNSMTQISSAPLPKPSFAMAFDRDEGRRYAEYEEWAKFLKKWKKLKKQGGTTYSVHVLSTNAMNHRRMGAPRFGRMMAARASSADACE